ncbi:putative phosphoesterase [Bradyrhizobium ottawaense]|uniref:metallophosphoesterase family protein n=1 Tax=Bradyrhizobium ottawaense TaxID=931866 RepID=UPI0038347F61
MTRLAVVADVHGNLPALEAVVSAIGDKVDGWICAGDIAGHLPMINEVVTCLRRLNAICVRGNHEDALLSGRPIRKSSAATRSLQIQRRLVSAETSAWLAALPARVDLEVDGRQLSVCHGGPNDPVNEKVRLIDDVVRAYAAGRIVVFGNTHRPFAEIEANHAVLNPGAVGLPVDGDRRAQAMILDVATRKVEMFRVDYDPTPVEALMRVLGYDERYFNCLASGRWVGFTGTPPRTRVLIVGADIYGEMIAELIRCRSDLELIGFVDDRVSGRLAEAPVLGPLARLAEIADAENVVDVAVAVGENETRRTITERVWCAGVRPARLIHPAAVVSPTARLGFGCIVDAGAYVGPHCVLEDGVSVWPHVMLSHHTAVSAYASFKPGSVIGGHSRIAAGEKIALGAVWPSHSVIGPP